MSTAITLTLSSYQVRVNPGSRITLTAMVTNRSAMTDDYLLTVSGVDSSWVTFGPPVIRVAPNGQATTSVIVQPPPGAPAQNVTAIIQLISQRSGSTAAQVPLQLVMQADGVAAPGPGVPPIAGQMSSGVSPRRAAAGAPPWLIALSAVGGVALIGVVGAIIFLLFRGHGGGNSSTGSLNKICANPSGKKVSLANYHDDPQTAIVLSNEDESDSRVLRTEPASTMPGLFDALLALSQDASRIAFVTAHSEMMDDAHIWYIDVAHPSDRKKLADIPIGLWTVQPVWSPDNTKLAFARLNEDLALKNETQLELWIAPVGGTPTKVASLPQSQIKLNAFYGDKRASLCWASDNKTLLIQNVAAKNIPSRSPTATKGPTSTPTAVPPTPKPGQPTFTPAPPPPPPTPTAVEEEEPPQQIQVDVQTGQVKQVEQPKAPPPPPGLDRVPPTTQAGSPCGVPILSQNDPPWRFVIMQAGGDTIGNYGCALTATSMMLNYYGTTISPAELSACLGSDADLLHWAQVNHCSKTIRFQDELDFTWQNIDGELQKGTQVIVGFRGGPAGMHFVVVTSGSGGGDGAGYLVTDPWDASTDKTLRYFMTRGYVPTWIVVYSGPERNCTTRLIKGIATPVPPTASPLGTPVPQGTATPLPKGTMPPAPTGSPLPQHWRTPGVKVVLPGE